MGVHAGKYPYYINLLFIKIKGGDKMLKDIKIKKGMSKEEVDKRLNGIIKLNSEIYLGNSHIHSWFCKCGNTFERTWRDIKHDNAYTCKRCAYDKIEQKYKERVESTGEFEYIKSYRKHDILPNGKVVGDSPYVQIKHKYCGSVYEILASTIGKYKCSRCCNKYENSFAYHIQQELNEPLNKYWDWNKNIVNPYCISKSSSNKVWIRCSEKDYHGSYEVTCNKFYAGRRCPYCSGSNGKIHLKDSFGYIHFDKVMNWHPDNNVSPFKVRPGSNKRYKFKCFECGYEWNPCLYSVSNGCWCPKCKESIGEKYISKFLTLNNIEYKRQHKFDDCKFKKKLPFDFYLPQYNVCIEFDGKQHYKIGCFNGDIWDFVDIKIRDTVKTKYCKDNSIKLIRISYREIDNIDEILNKQLINNR